MKKVYIGALFLLFSFPTFGGSSEKGAATTSSPRRQSPCQQQRPLVCPGILKEQGQVSERGRLKWDDACPPRAVKFFKAQLRGPRTLADEKKDDAPARIRLAKKKRLFVDGGLGNGWRQRATTRSTVNQVQNDFAQRLQVAHQGLRKKVVSSYYKRMGKFLSYAQAFVCAMEGTSFVEQLKAFLSSKEIAEGLRRALKRSRRNGYCFGALQIQLVQAFSFVRAHEDEFNQRSEVLRLDFGAQQGAEQARLAVDLKTNVPFFLGQVSPLFAARAKELCQAEQALRVVVELSHQQPDELMEYVGWHEEAVAIRSACLNNLMENAALNEHYRLLFHRFISFYRDFWRKMEHLLEGQDALDELLGIGYESLAVFERTLSTACSERDIARERASERLRVEQDRERARRRNEALVASWFA